MSDLRHLFRVGQRVRIKQEADFTNKVYFENGTVTETHEDHIIVYIDEIEHTAWFERDWNLDKVYPIYNFCD